LPIAGNELKRHAAKLVGASGPLGTGSDGDTMGRMLGLEEPEREPRGRALVEILKFAGIPQFKQKEWDWRARRSARQLDPDIAALHSISLSAALQMQYRRNRKRYEEEFFANIIGEEDRTGWLKRFGLDWL
jgi:hypothetical protein